MKKLIPLLTLILLLTACGGKTAGSPSDPESVSGSDNSGIGDTPTGGNTSDGEGSEAAGTGGQAINHDNPREYFTAEEAAEIIDRSENMKVSDEYFYALVPKSIDHVSEFYVSSGVPLSRQEALDEFISVFEYLFPGKELNKKCLYYMVSLPDDPNVNDVDGMSEEYLAALGLHPIYDEKIYNGYMDGTLGTLNGTSFFVYLEELYPNENSVSLTMRSPFGNDLCYFNKGVAQKLFEKRPDGNSEFSAWQHFYPDEDTYFKYLDRFTPDSEEKFMLLDKEISIKDAAKNFEDYIASIPCASESVYGLRVNKAYVYEADGTHYLSFDALPVYDGIPLDTGTLGGMIKSDDVEYVYGTYRARRVLEETPHSEILPFEQAVGIASEKMTAYVDFKVEEAELVYRVGANVSGSMLLGETKQPAVPSWMFRLHNPNDSMYYYAYVNALTGDFSVTTSKY